MVMLTNMKYTKKFPLGITKGMSQIFSPVLVMCNINYLLCELNVMSCAIVYT